MRCFAIIPAAGRSRRMGRPKLLLPWRGTTLLAHLIRAWRAANVDRVQIVAHPEDGEVAEIARAEGAAVVIPETPPAEMKLSVLCGLHSVERECRPAPDDAWLLAPADMPQLTTAVIDRVLAAWRQAPENILVPVHGRRRGHPVAFPWSLAGEVESLGEREGINALLQRRPVMELVLDHPGVLVDIDTPEDFRRLGGGRL